MVSEERLVWLLGEELPVRVIPARFRASREHEESVVAPVDRADHTTLRDLLVRAHPDWIQRAHIKGVHNETLHHRDEGGKQHHLVISSANRKALDAHLDSGLWLLAKPSSPGTGPQPIYLEDVVARAVLEETGSSVVELLAGPREEMHVHYHDLLDTAVVAVRDRAVAALEDGLAELQSAGIIDEEERGVIDAGNLIDVFLRTRAEGATGGSGLEQHQGHAPWLQARPAAVLTRFGAMADGHDLSFSFSDIGSIEQGDPKSYVTTGRYCELFSSTVNVTSGELKVKISGGADPTWTVCHNSQNWDSKWSFKSPDWKQKASRTVIKSDPNPLRIIDCVCDSGKVQWKLCLTASKKTSVTASGTFGDSRFKQIVDPGWDVHET